MAQVMGFDEALKKANSLYVDEHFKEALEYYSLAVELDDGNVDTYLKRSLCHTQLGNFTDALEDAQKAITFQPNNPKGYLRKGIAYFELEEFESALTAFEKGFSLDPNESNFKTWIRKCKAEIEAENPDTTPTLAATATPSNPTLPTSSSADARVSITAPSSSPSAPPPTSTPAPQPKIRHEWYQNPTHVTVTIYAKGVKKENLSLGIEEQSLSVQIKLSDDSNYVLDLDLADGVIPSQSSHEILGTKIEIKLKKSQSLKWDTLERPSGGSTLARPYAPTTTPSNSSSQKNWDKIAKEEFSEEKLEGEAGLNKVFQDIYSSATEEQRRAMMKSFTESGGTVLSTNWEDVGKGPVKGSPPQGMEMHKWSDR